MEIKQMKFIATMKTAIFLSSFFFPSFFFPSSAQSIGNGKDGSPKISGIINIYTPAISDIYKCKKIISVKNTAGFFAGDLILIIQMQGAKIDGSNTASYGTIMDYSNSGSYEYAIVAYIVNSNTIALEYPVLRNFSVNGKTQIIRVPQYSNPAINGTLTCKKWDGETGGVLAFDASGTIMFNAAINVNSKGFRGGKAMQGEHFFSYSHEFSGESYDPDMFSLKGEGIAFDGMFPFTSGRGAPANGGGGGNIHTAGGGGGSNYGCGGKGGWGYPVDTLGNYINTQGIGGYALDYSVSGNRIFMGGGGGAGHEHFNNGTDGGDGGGIVIITADSIRGNSKFIMANGSNSAGSGAFGDGTGGAGAGGAILLAVQNFSDTTFISAKGGDGGSSIMRGFGPGGGAGGGTLWLPTQMITGNIVISSLDGGTAGFAGGSFYGAENGCNGGIFYDLKIPYNNSYNGVEAEFAMSPAFLSEGSKTIFFTNKSSGASGFQWYFGDETSDLTESPSHTYIDVRNYDVLFIAKDSLCSDTTSKNITAVFYPNIFTPNGDGKNDFFYIVVPDSVPGAELIIFNRWGRILFQNTAAGKTEEIKWDGLHDGRKIPEGNYYFIFTYTLPSKEQRILKGSLTLFR